VKARFFRFLLHGGNDAESELVYRKHIVCRRASGFVDAEKITTDDYVKAAKSLAQSMSHRGFDDAYPIPVDRFGELLGGAHRTACAIVLGMIDVPVAQHVDRAAWAPPWGRDWFEMYAFDVERIEEDWQALRGA
jgi:hypothetical protein